MKSTVCSEKSEICYDGFLQFEIIEMLSTSEVELVCETELNL